jgi:MFS transporter, DHA1 family, multidrug resistance protein
VLGYMSGTLAGGRMTRRMGIERMVRVGGWIAAAGGLILAFVIWTEGASVPGILLPTTVYMLGTGLILPNAMAGAIGPFPRIAGTAAALLGFVQMGIAAAVGVAIGHLADGTARPMAAGIAICGLLQPAVERLLISYAGRPGS